MTSRLILSFWDLCLDNLPQGCFERRTIPAAEARAMIRTARADNVLLCVSEDDLLAPYKQGPRRRHAALCAVLQNAYDISLRFEDFLSSFADQDGAVQSVTPLQVVSLQPGERMLVVTCSYAFAKADGTGDPDERFAIAEDSVGFN
jgi:hypothetical protein